MRFSLLSPLRGLFVALPVLLVAACTSAPEDISASSDDAISAAPYQCSKPEQSGKFNAHGTGAQPIVKDIRAAGHPGFDRVVIELSGPAEAYEIEETSSATFYQDASGEPLTVPGTAGLSVLVRGVDWTHSGSFPSFAVGGGQVMTSVTLGTLFEGDLTFGVGLRRQGCYHAFVLDSPTRLVIDVQNDGPAPSWGPEGLPAFACGAYPPPSAGIEHIPVAAAPAASADVATTLVRKRVASHADDATPYDRFVLEFTGGTVPPQTWMYRQSSPSFTGTGEGPGSVKTLPGTAGIGVVMQGGVTNKGAERIADAPGTSAFTGAALYDDFEGQTEWGIGLTKQACYRAFTLLDPPRVVIDVKR